MLSILCLGSFLQFIITFYIRWFRACVCTPSYTVDYNVNVNGYFKGTRGLRQGDPLSPYLFVIAMNCLSKLLNDASANECIGFHPQTESTRLTHLSFADNLLIFIDGSLSSVQNVLQVLHDFEQRSGSDSVSKSLASSVQAYFNQRSMKYKCLLECPMDPFLSDIWEFHYAQNKLNLANCERLIQQVKVRFNSQTVKTLSFARRLLLIKTAIEGITIFWCSSIVLPKACVNRIKFLCSVFLWKVIIEALLTARVAC